MSAMESPGQEPATSAVETSEVSSVPVESPTTTAPVETAEADIFDDANVQTFDRDYVTKLRKEAADYRTQAKAFKDVFDGYDADSQNILMNVISTMKSDPTAGAQQLREIAEFLSPAEIKAIEDAADTNGDTAEEPELSVEERVEKAIQERETKAQEQAQIQEVISKAKELGYPEGDPDHVTLLWIAQNQTDAKLSANERLEAAAKVIADRNQKIIDNFISSKADTNSHFVRTADGASPPPSGDGSGKPKSFAEARARAEQRIAAAARGGDQ